MAQVTPKLTDHRLGPVRDRGLFTSQVLANEPLCREHFLLRLRVGCEQRTGGSGGAFPATQPGQFIQLGCRQPDLASQDAEGLLGGELSWSPDAMPQPHQVEFCQPTAFLRRPFSLAGRGEDEQGTWVEVIHRVVGVGTDWLSHLKPGDAVDLIGPLGNAFELPASKSLALLVGGGVGLPPMFYLAEALRAAGWDAIAFVGAMTRDLLAVHFNDTPPSGDGTPTACVEQFDRHGYGAVITTDDGSLGLKGRITAGLDRVLDDMSDADKARAVLFTCGPEPMMHAASTLAESHGVTCEVCLEQAMACGLATCQSCVVKIACEGRWSAEQTGELPHGETRDGRDWRYRLACTDGPVFQASEVVW